MKFRRRNPAVGTRLLMQPASTCVLGWVAAVLLLSPPVEAAALGSTAALDSEAMLRGISQTGGRPSLRLGLEIEAARGPYAGVELASVLSRLDDRAGRAESTNAVPCLQPSDPGYNGTVCAPAKSHETLAANASPLERDRRLSLYAGLPLVSGGSALLQATLAQHFYMVGRSLERDYRELRLDSSFQARDGFYVLSSFISDDYYGSSTLSGGAEASYTHQLFSAWRTQLLAGAVIGNAGAVPDYGYGRIGLIWSQRRLTVGLYGHATQYRAEGIYSENLVRPRLTLSVDYRLF